MTVLAIDVYGTLINTHGVVTTLETLLDTPEQAMAFSNTWRDKQLEYSFRRGLMQLYADFSVCTRQALEYTAAFHDVDLNEEQRQQLMDSYRTLPAFEDVPPALEQFKAAGHQIYAFSNGSSAAVEMLLKHAGIYDYFDGVVSVEVIRSFKPNPAIYAHFMRESGVTADEIWLVSGNPFDVIGGISSGMRGAWVQRNPATLFDPWGVEPTVTVDSLQGLVGAIAGED